MIVTDGDLKKLIQQKSNPLLTGFDPPNEWKGKDSLVQPCSIDLHIGEIFQAGVKPGKKGSAGNPRTQLVLRTGQTAIVATQESIHLPADYAGFGFPPSKVSSRALLMTNPGHIDPGYNGHLQFTVINMGREDYVLRSKDLIVTLLIFKLASNVDADYAVRNPGSAASTITQSHIDVLAPDFVDVQKRAAAIARKTLGYATAGATVLAIILGWAFNAIDKRLGGIDEMQKHLIRLEADNTSLAVELRATKDELEREIALERRLATIESHDTPKGSSK